MDDFALIKSRHSVRIYKDRPLEEAHKKALEEKVEDLNQREGVHFRLVWEEPKLFKQKVPSYGQFKNVHNYLLVAGDKDMDPMVLGYLGEDFLLYAQSLGVNSCWVGMARFFNKNLVQERGQKLFAVITLGYGINGGNPRPSKSLDQVTQGKKPYPDWFIQGVEASLLAPTARNQQKFVITLKDDGQVDFHHKRGFFARLDLGIVKYHFDLVTKSKGGEA